jgi:MFS family permease
MLKMMGGSGAALLKVPELEKTTFDVSLVHFLLMFGYKLFSLYYPLYLISVGVSVLNVGNIYFLTYFIISISCFVINFYIHKINPAKTAALGVFGYGVFALLMLMSQNIFVFYTAQIILGISAAAWLVSLRFILMNSKTKSQTKSFGWFYSMPDYATAIAPAIGGLIILKFGFHGVFFASVLIQFFNAVYAYWRLRGNEDIANYNAINSPLTPTLSPGERGNTGCSAQGLGGNNDKNNFNNEKLLGQLKRYREVFRIMNDRKNVFAMLFFIFCALILGGIYRAFFVLFLKDLSFSQDDIIKFASAASFVYIPFSILVIKIMGKFHKTKIVGAGIALEGATAIAFGALHGALSYGAIFALNILDSMGELASSSGKSAFFAKKLENFKQEASAIDSIMTTLGPALGGLIGGLAVSVLGYRETFLIAGILVFTMGVYSMFFRFRERKNHI